MDSGKMTEWLSQRPKWLQIAAKRLLESNNLSDDDISELVELCQKEVDGKFPDINCIIPEGDFGVHKSEKIHLCSISEVVGVNKLAPKKPLNFGRSNIAIVYGCNGSGKSGYVRLLKHVCGARDFVRGSLLNNVFAEEDMTQKATITYEKSGTLKEFEWEAEKVCEDLYSVDIFDTSFGKVFMDSKNEVNYEPPVLSFLSRLIDVCGRVDSKFDTELKNQKLIELNMPEKVQDTPQATWFEGLSHETTTEDIEEKCSFSPEKETEIQELEKRIKERSPADKAKQLKIKKSYVDKLISDTNSYLDKMSDENRKRISDAKKKVATKEEVVKGLEKGAFRDEKLEGVGSDVWKELWGAARKYSEEIAYAEQEFPNIEDGSVCVLCHQSLSEEAKKRFSSFELYIKGDAQQQLVDAKKDRDKLLEGLPGIPGAETLKTEIDAAGIEDQEIIEAMDETFTTFRSRKEKLCSLDSEDDLKDVRQPLDWVESIGKISQEYGDIAKKYEEDAKKDNRIELQDKSKNLLANKWLAEHKKTIKNKVDILKTRERLESAKKKAITTALSKKKGELSESLITEAFVGRFNNELKELGAGEGLNVELIKSGTTKGKVLHTLKLKKSGRELKDILSEGESRIVSIASFLAEVTGRKHQTPLVFDDPISSLDHRYEEAVSKRLCSIASDRQVIIFTHRLSLLGLIHDDVKENDKIKEDNIIYIQKEPWGTGEPGRLPFQAQNPKKALNSLINDDLSKAKKMLEKEGSDTYRSFAVALCREFRNLLERMVEYELMSDIVQRYRRAINTNGKIKNLAKISKEDCECFDDLMTKYSRYVHSQPAEILVEPPSPEEFKKDFEKLKEWHEKFKKRGTSD